MARVPRSYPVEDVGAPPGKSHKRCGDSYQSGAFVTGEIPGLDFGGVYNRAIKPIYFEGMYTDPADIPNFGKNGWEYHQFTDEVRARIDSAMERINMDDIYPEVAKNRSTLEWPLEHAHAELDAADDLFDDFKPALPPAEGEAIAYPADLGAKVINRVRDALRHLRCAEYWSARLALYSQAVEAYEPPPRDPSQWLRATPGEYKPPLGFRAPPPGPVVLPDPSELPPPDAVGEASPSDVAQRWKVAAAFAGVVAAFFFLPRLMAINPRTRGRR